MNCPKCNKQMSIFTHTIDWNFGPVKEHLWSCPMCKVRIEVKKDDNDE